jgi:hypothetical protein
MRAESLGSFLALCPSTAATSERCEYGSACTAAISASLLSASTLAGSNSADGTGACSRMGLRGARVFALFESNEPFAFFSSFAADILLFCFFDFSFSF